MKKALQIINKLKNEGLIEDYAIGGGVGTMYYTEPITTYDLDIFITIREKGQGIILLTPIFDYLKGKGYKWSGEHIILDDYPVQFIVADDLEKDAVSNARDITYQGVKTKVMGPEHLIAILLRAGRAKDILKVRMILEQYSVDKKRLSAILTKYKLKEKYRKATGSGNG
jgi:hypothetical protein